MRGGSLLCLASLAAARPQWRDGSSNGWSGGRSGSGSHSAAYFLENDPAGNNIVSLNIGQDGLVADPIRTSTGGYGSITLNSSNLPVPVDSLNSQNSLLVVDNLLFAINAGSNTLSLFTISPMDPFHPRLVGTPIDTLGDFPVSVTYSALLEKACVINSGATAGVACYSVDPWHGLQADGGLRKLSNSIINETTPPHGPPGGASQVLFNPDSSALFATVKGYPGPPVLPGSLLAWPINDGQVSTSGPVVSKFQDIILDFGFQFLDRNRLFLSDPTFGISLLSVDGDLTARDVVHTVIADQAAVCWTEAWQDTLYAIDAGSNQIWTLSASTGALEGSINVTNTGGQTTKGVFDSAISGDLMYSLAGANGIIVVDLTTQEQVQFLDLSSFGNRQYYIGMAIWSGNHRP